MAEFKITLEQDVVNMVENPHYRVDVAAMNVARGVANGNSLDNPAYAYQLELLKEAVTDYSQARGKLTREIVDPYRRDNNIKQDVNWNLDFQEKVLTITPVGPELEYIDNDITVDEETVEKLKELDMMTNVYAFIVDRVGDTFNDNGKAAYKLLFDMQTENSQAYDEAKRDVETRYVIPFLTENNIPDHITWKLDFSSGKVTISK